VWKREPGIYCSDGCSGAAMRNAEKLAEMVLVGGSNG